MPKPLKDGYHVISFDNLLYRNQSCVLNKIHDPNYEFIYGDMLDTDLLRNSIERVDCVILLAGLVGDPITKKYPKESIQINDQGVKNVIDICADYNTNKFIFISTCSNYGFIKNDHLANEDSSLQPLSSYAKSKVKAEKYILSLKSKTKMNPVILRFATAFGLSPRMRFDLTISEFTLSIANGNDLLVYDENTWRPYCHVQDFSRLIKIVLDAPIEKVSFQVFNAGGDKNNATKQMIIETILQNTSTGKIRYQKNGSYPRNYRVSFEKVNSVLNFKPVYSIEDGVTELLDVINLKIFDKVDKNKKFYGNYKIDYKR